MVQTHWRRTFVSCLTVLLALSLSAPLAWGQHGSEGRVNVTVVDPQGAVVTGAGLTLIDLATNDARTVLTNQSGTYTFINLDIGTYRLSVTMAGFATQTLDTVVVQASKTTDIKITLAIGTQAQTVQVEAVAPVLETTTNAIGQVINPEQIEALPISGRDLGQLSRLGAGYNGLFNGLPTYAQGNNVDGVVGQSSRMKFAGNAQPGISPRLENMEEMTVSTDAMDMNQGFGQAAMQVGFITKRGSNVWHGRAYEDFRNDWLNANTWRNNATGAKRNRQHLNDFGGSVGGPIFKDKLFFFASLATQRQPGTATGSNNVLSAAAQAGNFSYVSGGVTRSVNVLTAAKAANASLPNAVNSVIGSQLAMINKALALGQVASTSDPIVNSLTFQNPRPVTFWYPTLRMDYNMSSKIRMSLSLNRTLRSSPGDNLPYFPGSDFVGTQAGTRSDNATAAYGLDWTITPHLINQLKVGWNYNGVFNSYNASKGYFQDPFEWDWPIVTSGKYWQRPINTYYPITNISDTASWQKGAHNLSFGYSFVREHDHYWNGPEGIAGIGIGLVNGDPALDALSNVPTNCTVAGPTCPFPGANTAQQTEGQNLYALLTGRINGFNRGLYAFSTKTNDYFHGVSAFPLNEVASSWGLFAQDSWRLRPNLTVNYGLRWDFTGDDFDRTSEYHNSGYTSIFGPTAPGDLFKPGTLAGNASPTIESRPHAYNGWNVSPQPSLGFTWSPQFDSGILKTLTGGKDATVIRGGYNLRNFTIPYQYVWNYASTCGSFYYQNFSITPSNAPGVGNFAPGSLSLGQALPAYAITPAAFQKVAPESQFTFTAGAGTACGINVTGIKPNIAQPYVQSWNFGIQRRLGPSTVLEVRYNGNRGLKEWLALNTNEVNIFENGFLKEFQAAQNNLKINGGGSFANLNPAAGTVPLPILTAAFTGASASQGFANTQFITWLNTGAAGSFASRLTTAGGAVPYFCNLVGTSFTPCATNLGYKGAGAGYPINFFQANPYAARNGTNRGDTALMTDSGYSSYNALQVDIRQQAWHGMQFDANYTWSKTLGTLAGGSGNDWLGNYTGFTLRNLRSSYMPATFDVHHVVRVNGTAELPFGKGKKWANGNSALDRVVGGWVVGSIVSIQSGFPFRLAGGYNTYNQTADSGLILKGITRQQLQDSIAVRRIPGASFTSPSLVTLIDPKYLAVSNPSCLTTWSAGCSISGLNTNYIDSNTTPGTYAAPLWLYGPHGFYQDVMVTKNVHITERIRFNLQSVFLNAWNHPVFSNVGFPIGGNPRSSGIFTTTGANSNPISGIASRQIELRANIIF